jgi:hypothetical protein
MLDFPRFPSLWCRRLALGHSKGQSRRVNMAPKRPFAVVVAGCRVKLSNLTATTKARRSACSVYIR